MHIHKINPILSLVVVVYTAGFLCMSKNMVAAFRDLLQDYTKVHGVHWMDLVQVEGGFRSACNKTKSEGNWVDDEFIHFGVWEPDAVDLSR